MGPVQGSASAPLHALALRGVFAHCPRENGAVHTSELSTVVPAGILPCSATLNLPWSRRVTRMPQPWLIAWGMRARSALSISLSLRRGRVTTTSMLRV